MTPNAIFIGAAAIGIVAQAIAVVTFLWRGGFALGTMQSIDRQLLEEVKLLRDTQGEQGKVLERVVTIVDGLERRVEYLEHPR